MTPRATVSASTAASSAPAAPRQWPIIDLSDVTGTDAARSPNTRRTAARLGAIVLRRRGAVALTWSTAVGVEACVRERARDHRPRPACPSGSGAVGWYASQPKL